MFKVKAVVTDFLGDKEKYPCHHQYKMGDEFIFDGESFTGRICPSLAIQTVPRMIEVHAAGPLYRDYLHYYPFRFSPLSVEAPELKIYDGIGFKNIFTGYTEPPYHMANLASSSNFKWPPPAERTVSDVRVICPDFRTAVVVKIEAFDLCDKGRSIPFFRRAMVILDRIVKEPGITADKILAGFTRQQIEGIYPALSPIMVNILLEHMQLTGYIDIEGGKAVSTQKGKDKLSSFKAGLSVEERTALEIDCIE